MEELSSKEIREKLISRGIKSLTDSELLSIIIQELTHSSDGTHGVATKLLQHFGSLSEIAAADLPRLRSVASLGIKNAAILVAATEFGRRISKNSSNTVTAILSDDDVETIFRPIIGSLPHEEMWVIYLSTANTILDKVKISQGGVSATIFDHKLIVKRAVELLATGMILVHNHPSGNATPSDEDIRNTDKASLAASLFDITLLDHIIISTQSSYSFRKHGLLTNSPK